MAGCLVRMLSSWMFSGVSWCDDLLCFDCKWNTLGIRYEYLFKADKIRFKAVFKESRYLNAFFEMFCLAVNWEVRNTEGLCSKSKSHQPFDIMHGRNNDLVMVIYVVGGGGGPTTIPCRPEGVVVFNWKESHPREQERLYINCTHTVAKRRPGCLGLPRKVFHTCSGPSCEQVTHAGHRKTSSRSMGAVRDWGLQLCGTAECLL